MGQAIRSAEKDPVSLVEMSRKVNLFMDDWAADIHTDTYEHLMGEAPPQEAPEQPPAQEERQFSLGPRSFSSLKYDRDKAAKEELNEIGLSHTSAQGIQKEPTPTLTRRGRVNPNRKPNPNLKELMELCNAVNNVPDGHMRSKLVRIEVLKRGQGLASLIYDQVKSDAVDTMTERMGELEKQNKIFDTEALILDRTIIRNEKSISKLTKEFDSTKEEPNPNPNLNPNSKELDSTKEDLAMRKSQGGYTLDEVLGIIFNP